MQVVTDEQWSTLEPLLDAVRPRAPQPIRWFRRTIEAIVWRLQNGAKWRAIPTVLGPWWLAAQTFIRRSRLGVWERLHRLAQARQRPELGLVFLDGTVIRAHQKAAGAKGGTWGRRQTPGPRPSAVPAAATAPRRTCSRMPAAGRSPSR